MTSEILIQGGQLSDGSRSDLLVRDGIIVEIAPGIESKIATVVSAQESIVLPGLVDLHTHLREPGKEDSETVQSGSRAGAKGGYVALSAMANTSLEL